MVACHLPVASAFTGISAAAGTSPGPTSSPNDDGSPAGNDVGAGEGSGDVAVLEEGLSPPPQAVAVKISRVARRKRRIVAMVSAGTGGPSEATKGGDQGGDQG